MPWSFRHIHNAQPQRQHPRYEECCNCSEHTGRAGRSEDSIYVEDFKGQEIGPLCEACYDEMVGNGLVKPLD